MQGLAFSPRLAPYASQHLIAAMRRTCDALHLDFVGFERVGDKACPIVRIANKTGQYCSRSHPCVLDAFKKARLADELPADLDRYTCCASTPAGQHALRVHARALLFASIPSTRNDCEGHKEIDITAQSHPIFTQWRKQLNYEQRELLTIYRGGGSWTPTRRFSGCGEQNIATTCKFCKHPYASMKHFFSDCEHFKPARLAIGKQYRINYTWWAAAPRILSKSGFATLTSAGTLTRRATLQVAACKLGIVILSDPGIFQGKEGMRLSPFA